MTIRLKGSTLLTKYLDRMGFGSLLQNLFFLRTCPRTLGSLPQFFGVRRESSHGFHKASGVVKAA
jgi:hypothetical protein